MLGAAVLALHLEMAREVAWGYGCGGNCAIRNEGHSAVTITTTGARVEIVDEGWHKLSEHHPGGGMLQETRWRTVWTGKAKLGKDHLRFEVTGATTCTRHETHDDGGKTEEVDTGCPRTPKAMRLDCAPAEVVAGGKPVKAWTCRAARLPPGTVQPWVFGVDVIVDEQMAGEPRPEASYSVR